MPTAFGESADFSGISEQLLKIRRVIHKALIKSDETGSEASGASVVESRDLVSAPDYPRDFIFDRPGLIVLRDTQTGTILFLGRLANPASK